MALACAAMAVNRIRRRHPGPRSGTTPHLVTNPLGPIRIEMERGHRIAPVRSVVLRAGDSTSTRGIGNLVRHEHDLASAPGPPELSRGAGRRSCLCLSAGSGAGGCATGRDPDRTAAPCRYSVSGADPDGSRTGTNPGPGDRAGHHGRADELAGSAGAATGLADGAQPAGDAPSLGPAAPART